MSLVRCLDLGMEFAGDYVLRGVNCTIEHNNRIGLIGINGSGKSTLIRLILGEMTPSLGSVERAKNLRIAYLEQNPALQLSKRMIDYVREAREDILELNSSMQLLSQKLDIRHDEKIQERLEAVVSKMDSIGAFEHANRIKYVLESLGFAEDEWEKRIADFSGGERTRITLARILLSEYDLLILDEPTNHLDLAMISWLESFLAASDKPYLVVSHDRVFLDAIAGSIYALEGGELSITKGNYSSYFEAAKIARLTQEREAKRQEKFIAETQDFIRRNMAGQKTKQAQARQKLLDKLEPIQRVKSKPVANLRMGESRRSGNDLFAFKDAAFGIDGVRELAREIELSAFRGDRIALIGKNGCGKTTLLRILTDKHEVSAGLFKKGASLDIGYFDQHQNYLDESLTVLETIWRLVPSEPRGYVLSWLARFSFRGDDVDKQVSVLSGGEKSRLYLAAMIHEKPNLLILDEPTNHLDIPMRDALLQALQEYDGSIIFVSHDRHFIRSLATKYWHFQSLLDEHVQLYTTVRESDLELDEILRLAFTLPEIKKDAPPPRERKRRVNPLALKMIQDEIDALCAKKNALKSRLEEIHGVFADSAIYSDSERLMQIKNEEGDIKAEISAMKHEITKKEDQYLELACDE